MIKYLHKSTGSVFNAPPESMRDFEILTILPQLISFIKYIWPFKKDIYLPVVITKGTEYYLTIRFTPEGIYAGYYNEIGVDLFTPAFNKSEKKAREQLRDYMIDKNYITK